MLGTSTSRMSCPNASRTGRSVHSWSRWPSVVVRPVGDAHLLLPFRCW